jgi:hypothetical protein
MEGRYTVTSIPADGGNITHEEQVWKTGVFISSSIMDHHDHSIKGPAAVPCCGDRHAELFGRDCEEVDQEGVSMIDSDLSAESSSDPDSDPMPFSPPSALFYLEDPRQQAESRVMHDEHIRGTHIFK